MSAVSIQVCQQCSVSYTCTPRFHIRTVHQTKVQVLYSDGMISMIERNPNTQVFACTCGNFDNIDPQAIRRHAARHQSTATTEHDTTAAVNSLNHNESTVANSAGAGLHGAPSVIHNLLNIYYNSEYNLLLCTRCLTGIMPKSFVAHVRSHGISEKIITTSDINQYLRSLPTPHSPTTISNPKRIVKPIEHLQLHLGFACLVSECHYYLRNSKGIYIHCRQHHPSTMGHRPASIQRFFENNNSPYFEVSNSTPSSPVNIADKRRLSTGTSHQTLSRKRSKVMLANGEIAVAQIEQSQGHSSGETMQMSGSFSDPISSPMEDICEKASLTRSSMNYISTDRTLAISHSTTIMPSASPTISRVPQVTMPDPDTILSEWIFSDIELSDDNEDEGLVDSSPNYKTNRLDPETDALQQLYGRDATWKDSFQQNLVKSSLQLLPDEGMLVILPTGYGKSLLFLVPAIVEPEKVTVVFIPLLALIDNIAASIRQRGIHCTVWGNQTTTNPAVKSLLLVSTDAYGSSEPLRMFISRLEKENRLGRVVLDEVHLILSAEYRAYSLQKIRGIRDRRVPIILLTATLPQAMEPKLLELLCFNSDTCKTWRLSSERLNIRYLLERPVDDMIAWEMLTGSGQNASVDGWFNTWSGYLQSGEKGIIFCITRAEAEKISKSLKIPAYHSALTTDERHNNLWSWASGAVSWIVGTSGLGAGIDLPNVKVVVHWGMPTDILDWVQMAGRGGRGIKWSYSITIDPQTPVYRRQPLYQSARESHPERLQMMLNVLSSTGCIRPLLLAFLDGNTEQHSCLQRQVEHCWVCAAKTKPLQTSTKFVLEDPANSPSKITSSYTSRIAAPTLPYSMTTIQHSRQQSGDVKSLMVEVLRRWGIGCTYCHILGKYGRAGVYPSDHTTQTCTRWEECGVTWGQLWNRDRGMRNDLKFKSGTCCFRCGCPRFICHQGRAGGSKTECAHGKVFMDAVFAASHWKEVRLSINQYLVQDPKIEIREFWKNSAKECMWENERCNRMILVAWEAARQLGLDKLYTETGSVL